MDQIKWIQLGPFLLCFFLLWLSWLSSIRHKFTKLWSWFVSDGDVRKYTLSFSSFSRIIFYESFYCVTMLTATCATSRLTAFHIHYCAVNKWNDHRRSKSLTPPIRRQCNAEISRCLLVIFVFFFVSFVRITLSTTTPAYFVSFELFHSQFGTYHKKKSAWWWWCWRGSVCSRCFDLFMRINVLVVLIFVLIFWCE